MANDTCSDPECAEPIGPKGGKGLCPYHYRRHRKQAAPPCKIGGCQKPRHTIASGLCLTHYTRAARYGDPLAPTIRTPNIGSCSVEGCDEPMRSRTWCVSHYSQWKLTGAVRQEITKWAEAGGCCTVCGQPVPIGSGRRKYCSSGCQAANSRTAGLRPKAATCDFCKREFTLGRTAKGGRLQRVDTKWCPDCGRDSPDVMRFKNYGITREQYEAAILLGCKICESKDRKLHVDHDHACCPTTSTKRTCGNCVRGLICGPCNRALGLFGDDPEALTRAASYLRHQT